MEIPKQAINKVVSLNIVKSRQGNFVTIFTEICFDTDDDNLMLRINVDGDDNCNDDADRCVGRHCTNTNTNTNCTNTQIQLATDRCVGRHCTWGSSPRASSAPQGAAGSTATPGL